MKINVGSQNKTKIIAVADAVKLYPNIFPDAEVSGISVTVEEFGHPKNIDEVVSGAVERAKNAFIECTYSFGIEGGLLAVPHSLSGFMEIQACAIFDGQRIHLGLSPAFEWPKKVTELILNEQVDASQALRLAGITEHKKLGAMSGGAIAMLTNGRLTREEQAKTSIISAMIQIERKEMYF